MLSEQIETAYRYIAERVSEMPQTGIILGSGLGSLAEAVQAEAVIPYSDIPFFPKKTVEGHAGRLIVGTVAGRRVAVMQGRFHYYQGLTPQEVVFPVRVMARMGVRFLIVSNASGGLNPDFRPGDIMIISDHINMIPNPLVGDNDPAVGVRFPEMTTVYDRSVISKVRETSSRLGIELSEGCYIGVTGPSFETIAECRFFRMVGADAVGMSTVSEVIAASHCGMKVLGFSVITNLAGTLSVPTHQEVLENGAKAQTALRRLVISLLSEGVGSEF